MLLQFPWTFEAETVMFSSVPDKVFSCNSDKNWFQLEQLGPRSLISFHLMQGHFFVRFTYEPCLSGSSLPIIKMFMKIYRN